MAEEIKDPMEYIWERVPKTKGGLIHYLPGDLPYLYQNGFVDTVQFTYDEWKAAFEDCKQSDDSYLVSYDKFMSLRRFRYTGPVYKPFDPHKVREGEWTDADLKKLFELSIKPSSTIPEEVYWNSVKALKSQGLIKNGNLLVNKAVKTQLAYLVERFPTPRRRLEKEVTRIREERETQLRQNQKDRDKSHFLTGKLASEVKMEQFKNLQRAAKSGPICPAPSSEGIDLKKLKKPPKKISG